MSRFIFIIAFFNFGLTLAQKPMLELKQLDEEITRKDIYIQEKQKGIQDLKTEARKYIVNRNQEKLYQTYFSLFKAYKSFKYDSAYYYIEQAKAITVRLKKPELQNAIKVQEGFVLLSSGLFKEAIDTLNSIDVSQLSSKNKYHYYTVKARAYYDLADYNNDDRYHVHYVQTGNEYLTQALKFVNDNTN